MTDFPSLMLCQDCLQVRPYSESAHFGEWSCECGGDFCGCNSCNDFALGEGADFSKQQAQVLPHERPESIPAPASPRGLRLLCLLVEKSGRKQFVPAVTLHPLPPRAPVSGSWALVCDPAFSLRETQAKPPRPSLLARYLRQWQANTLRPSF